jgi:hypothetical protein
MFKNVQAIAIAAAASAGLLVASASPSLACVNVTANLDCHESAEQAAPAGARLYNVAPGGSTTNSLRASAHRSPHRGPAPSTSR